MTVMMCIEERGGLSFGGRRVSRDRVVTADMLATANARLWIAPTSLPLFNEEQRSRVSVADDPLQVAGREDACLLEEKPPKVFPPAVDRVILYRWNRHYPADVRVQPPSVDEGWQLQETTELVGHSHPLITREVYGR